jgi:hypothetical protein
MISFSTEFPIDSDKSVNEVLNIACDWITGSRFTNISKHSLLDLLKNSGGDFRIGDEHIVTGLANLQDYEIAGLRYTKLQNEIEWITTIVTSKTPSQNFVSIQVSCEALNTANHLPESKKPVFVSQVIDKCGGGMDGHIPVSNKPYILTDGEEQVAADLIIGSADNSLPIVYISAGFDGSYIVDENKLSKLLSGMAHVVVEPSRDFSFKVKNLASSRNVYGGTVGIYWPDSTARKSYYFSEEYSTSELIQEAVARDIQIALANRRQKTYCNWLHLKECISKVRYEKLKFNGSEEVNYFVEAFKDELDAKQSKLDDAEREILRLSAELKKYVVSQRGGESGPLGYGKEQDFYEFEIRDFVIDSLNDSLKNSVDGGRRCHVFQDLLASNKPSGEAAKNCEEIKSLFKSGIDLDAKTKNALVKLGFSISEEGKHYKLVFQNDGRYTFITSKTSSDHRAGKNLTSDINKRLF